MQRDKRANAGSKMAGLIASQLAAGLIHMGTEVAAATSASDDPTLGPAAPTQDMDFASVDQEDIFDSDFDSTDEEDIPPQTSLASARSGDIQDIDPDDLDERAAALSKRRKKLDTLIKPVSAIEARDILRIKRIERLKNKGPKVMLEPMRQSGRSSTLESKRQMQQRLDKHDERRSMTFRPAKRKRRAFTQEELLTEARATEVYNMASLDHYKQIEDELKKNSALKKKRFALTGPILRTQSFCIGRIMQMADSDPLENVAAVVDCEDDSLTASSLQRNDELTLPSTSISSNINVIIDGVGIQNSIIPMKKSSSTNEMSIDGHKSSHQALDTVADEVKQAPPFQRSSLAFLNYKNDPFAHLNKAQPLPNKTCLISGEPAKYKCPKSGVPYANITAYKTLKSVLNGDYIWSSVLGSFVHRRDVVAPSLLPSEWASNLGLMDTPGFVDETPKAVKAMPKGSLQVRPPMPQQGGFPGHYRYVDQFGRPLLHIPGQRPQLHPQFARHPIYRPLQRPLQRPMQQSMRPIIPINPQRPHVANTLAATNTMHPRPIAVPKEKSL